MKQTKEADVQLEEEKLVGTSESGNGNIGVRDWVAQTAGRKAGSKMYCIAQEI